MNTWLNVWLQGLAAMCAMGTALWFVSLIKRDVSIVDSIWSLFFLVGGTVYALTGTGSARAWLVVGLVGVWALRLSIYITARNWGHEEDYRYQAMREKRGPSFAYTSLAINA